MKRTIKDYVIIVLKGMAMGAADVVPGVSGGTIAFISGIYEELLGSISSINISLIKKLKEEGLESVWNTINGNFLLSLLVGIAISVVSLAKGISHLLETKPILVWSFFFGLVVASIIYVVKQIKKWNVASILVMVLACLVAYYITVMKPLVNDEASWWFLILSGALAICAMILPGVSGAFILVLLGAYEPVLNAIHERNLTIIALVGFGAIAGLLSFSKILKWLFNSHKDITLAGLTGFIIGSLNKIWPWKETLTTRINSKGIEVSVLQKSISPTSYGDDAHLGLAVILTITGFLVIFLLEKIANRKK